MPSQKAEDALPAPTVQSRLFIGIKIAPEIAYQLAQFPGQLKASVVRPVAPADIHLTLVPPWNETSIPEAIAKLSGVTERFSAFWLDFRHVGYGPQPRRVRLLWVDCAIGDEGAALRSSLLDAFGRTDDRPFQPHVTLARIRVDGLAISRKFAIDEPLALRQHVESVELFQSPPPGGRGYTVVLSVKLQQTR